MDTKENPKLSSSNIVDCKPHCGACPLDCNQCFYNRPGAFYADVDEPHMPTPEEAGDRIVRVNSGHDSNLEREMVITETDCFERRFFNTSLPLFDFPAPVVFTANRSEEREAAGLSSMPGKMVPTNLMFVRLRVSPTNIEHIDLAVRHWTALSVPVVLTFMAYYDCEPDMGDFPMKLEHAYVWKTRITNSYWCPTPAFMVAVRSRYLKNRLVSICGGFGSCLCKDCHNCETYYWQTEKRMEEVRVSRSYAE